MIISNKKLLLKKLKINLSGSNPADINRFESHTRILVYNIMYMIDVLPTPIIMKLFFKRNL